MNLSRNFLILIIFTLILSAPLLIEAKADENTDIKKELQELKQIMKQMQNRIEDLEDRNQELEKQAKQKQVPHVSLHKV